MSVKAEKETKKKPTKTNITQANVLDRSAFTDI